MREDREVVGLVVRNSAATAQQLAHLVGGFGHVGMRRCLDADPVRFLFRVQFLEGREWKEDDVIVGILAAAEHSLALGGDAHHREHLAFDGDFLAEWLLVGEQFRRGVVTDHDHRGALFVIDFAEPAAGIQRQIVDVLYRGGVAFEDGLLGFAILVFDGIGADAQLWAEEANAGCDRLHMRQVLHGHRVFETEFFTRPHLFGHSSEGDFLMESENNIRTQRTDDLTYIVIQAADDRGNSNHHGDADHDAEDGQRRTQLVAADRVHRQLQDFTEFAFTDHYFSPPTHPSAAKAACIAGFNGMAKAMPFQSYSRTSVARVVNSQTARRRLDPASLLCGRDILRKRFRRLLPLLRRRARPTKEPPTASRSGRLYLSQR